MVILLQTCNVNKADYKGRGNVPRQPMSESRHLHYFPYCNLQGQLLHPFGFRIVYLQM